VDIAQISTVATTALLVALVAVAGFVGMAVYRARYSAAREAQYRTLAEQAAAAQLKAADGAQATVGELTRVREELGQVKQRLAALESLLSQIG
jgi:hypothetical protein